MQASPTSIVPPSEQASASGAGSEPARGATARRLKKLWTTLSHPFVALRRWKRDRRARQGRHNLRQGITILRNLDRMMHVAGVSRQERRALWRGIANSAEEREQVLNKLAQRLGINDTTPLQERAHDGND